MNLYYVPLRCHGYTSDKLLDIYDFSLHLTKIIAKGMGVSWNNCYFSVGGVSLVDYF